MAYPTVTFQLQLGIPVVIYDSFNNEDQAEGLTNYFGSLTKIGSIVEPHSTVIINPIHGRPSAYNIYDTNDNPIKRVFTFGDTATSFTITQADVDIINLTNSFVQLLKNSPKDPVSVSFKALIKDGKASPSEIETFFKNSANYKTCTNVSYMLVMINFSKTAQSKGKPLPEATYSLSELVGYLGIEWPTSFPDIVVSNFSCSDDNNVFKLFCDTDISNITFKDGVLANIRKILPDIDFTFRTKITFNLDPGLNIFYTNLEFDLPNIKIPIENGNIIEIDKPTIIITVSPVFKFIVFTVKGTIPFSLFNGPTFNADFAMTIDNVEAEIGVVLQGNGNTLLTPPNMPGVHFDKVGVGMGLIFEPPTFALGVQGTFHIGSHIGSPGAIKLDDDTFVVVCSLVEDVPNPLYISFYVPQMNISEVITIFTNQSVNIDYPISFTDLSFLWVEDPMTPITLPDGSLSAMAYGFSGNLNFFGLNFYGDVKINMTDGLTGNITMSPFSFGPLSLTGKGKGVTIKVDAKGNPIKCNFIPKTAVEKLAVKNAVTKQLIAPGGPEMTVSTSNSPYFKLDADLKFLGFSDSIDATVDKNGISFDLDFGAIIKEKMECVLTDYQNFSGNFSYGPDFTVNIPGNLGSIHIVATIHGELNVTKKGEDTLFSISGGFDLFGSKWQFGPFTLDVNITKIEDVITAIENWIIDNVKDLFKILWKDAEAWLQAIKKNVIQPLENDLKYLAQSLKTFFGLAAGQIATALKDVGYVAEEIAAALKDVGYIAEEIASALVAAFEVTERELAALLKGIEFGLDEVASAIKSVFAAILPSELNALLQDTGYAVSDIYDAFKKLGGEFESFVEVLWGDLKYYADPSNW